MSSEQIKREEKREKREKRKRQEGGVLFFNSSQLSSIIFFFFLSSFFFFSGCVQQTEKSRAEFALDTVCVVNLYEQGKSRYYQEIFKRIREIENLMSVHIPTSDISRINAAAGIEPVIVNEDTFNVIERAVYFAELSGGAFDPTVGPLVSLWNMGGENPHVPSQAEIDKVLPLINWRNIELDRTQRSVFLRHKEMSLDLGGIAKGYAADEAAIIIKKHGIERAIIDLGGNVIVLGEKKDKSPWRVGIQNPKEERGEYITVLPISTNSPYALGASQSSIVTSGVYQRFFEEDGKRYHHIFSSFDGYPVDNGLLSVTIIAPNSIDADALSTAVFVMGYEKGRKLIESLFETEAAHPVGAVFIFEDMSIKTTSGNSETANSDS